MEGTDVKNILKGIGIGGGIIAVVLVVGVVGYLYGSYLESKKTKLEIKILEAKLKNPAGITQGAVS